MTDPRAGPSRRPLLLLVLALVWMAAQAVTLDLAALLGGFNVNDAVSGAHHAYALLNVGAWIVLGVGGVSFLFQTGRWRSALTAVGAGGVAIVLQFYAIEAFQTLGADRFYGETTSVAIQAGATAEASAIAAAISTALLALLVALVGFVTGERGEASVRTEARRLGISVARSLRLRNFNVFSWLFGPVFQADVRVMGRRRGTYIGRAVYLALLLGILTIAWFGLRSDIDNYSGAERLQQMQELAPGLATFLLWTQFLLLLFIAPQLTAPVICQERTGRTLPALLTTPLTSAQIVFGKLAGRLMMAIVLILLSVPLLLGVRVYGGLDSAFVVKAVAITISATVLAASLGVLASIWSKRATTAGVVAIILLALHSIGLPLLIAFVVFGVSSQPPGWVFTISPAITLGMLTAEAMGDPVPFNTQYLWISNVGLNLAFAALTCLVATFAFRRVMVAEAHGQTITPGRKKKRRRKAAASPAGAHAGVDPASGEPEPTRPLSSEEDETVERTSREVGSSPVLWREIRQSAFGGGSKLRAILMCIGAVGLILLLNLYFGPREEGLHYGVLAIGMILLCASAAVAATGTVAGEREAGAWTILLTTPLSGPEILLGKFLGACRRCWVLPAMILLDSFLAIAAGAFSAIFLLHLAIIIPATIVFLCGTGTLASLCFRKSATAGVANIGLAVGSWVGVPMLVAFVSAVVGWSTDFEVAYTAMFSFNPVAMAEFALNGAADPSYVQYDGSYDMPSGMMTFGEFTLLLVVGMSLLAGAGLGALGLAAARFRFISERTS